MDAEISLRAEEIFHIGNFVVTNALFMGAIVAVGLLALFIYMRGRVSIVPGKIQNLFEMLFEQVFGLMDPMFGSREKSEKYAPLIISIFLFVLVSNWLGLVPGVGHALGVVSGHGEETHLIPLLRAPSSDLNFTIVLGIISVLFVNILGAAAIGWKGHLGKFFSFKSPINFGVGLLELVSEFARIISFSFRLFGNIFAGEVLLMIIGLLVPYIVPLPFLFLEVFVGLVQAAIFAMLTMVFLSTAVSHHDEEHEAKHQGAH